MRTLTFLLFISLNVLGQGGTKNFIDQNYIEVKGTGSLEVIPDKIFLSITVNEKDLKNKETISTIEKKMVEKLLELQIDVKNNLSIKEISSNYKNYLLLKSDILQSKHFQLILSDVKTISRVFIELEKLGISNIVVEKVEHSDIIRLKQEAKRKAIQDAKNSAEILVTSIDQRIGKALYIHEPDGVQIKLQGRAPGISIRSFNSIFGSRVPEEMQDIEFEMIKIESNIIVNFELL